jgi:hypothetical protein
MVGTTSTGFRGGFSTTVRVEGIDNVLSKLRQLPDKLTRNILLQAYRKSTKPMIKSIRSKTPRAKTALKRIDAKGNEQVYQPGNLAKSIGNITGKSKVYPNILVGARAGVTRKNDGFYAHFVHEGHRTASGSMTEKDPFIDKGFQATKVIVARSVEKNLVVIIEKKAKKLGFQ